MNLCILTNYEDPWKRVIHAMGVEAIVHRMDSIPNVDLKDSVLLLDARHMLTKEAFDLASKTEVCVVLGSTWMGDQRVYSKMPFCAERYGSLVIQHTTLYCVGLDLVSFKPTHGPGVVGDQGRPVLWSKETFNGLGDFVGRDDEIVISAIYEAIQGKIPLWFEPGFPGLIPDVPRSFKTLDGSNFDGVLCSSASRPGGWVVLRDEDLLTLLGYRGMGVSSWAELKMVMPFQAAAHLISWLFSSTHGSVDSDSSALP